MRQSYIQNQFGSLMESQTWKDEESVSKQELRSALISTACALNNESYVAKAKSLFKTYTDSNFTFK